MITEAKHISEAVLAKFCDEAGDVTLDEALTWMARGWLEARAAPGRAPVGMNIAARLVLIRDIRRDMGVEEASVDVVLDLIDKLRLQTEMLACLNEAIDRSDALDTAAVRALAAEIFHGRVRRA